MVPLSFPRDQSVFLMALMGNFLLKFGVYVAFKCSKICTNILIFTPLTYILPNVCASTQYIQHMYIYIYIYVCIYYIYTHLSQYIPIIHIMPTFPPSCFLARGNNTVTNPDLETKRQQLRCDYPRLVDDCRSSYGVFHRSV